MTMGSRKTADFFAREAKKLGYAARSALKLTEIQDRFKVMRKGDVVLDLGCHPGAWTQVSSERVSVNGAVLGVDLTATRADALGPRVDPKRTTLATGDVFDLDPAKLRAMASSGPGTSSGKSGSVSSGRPFASVLSDMAPSTSGDGVRDAALSYELAEQAVRLALGDGALAVLDDDDDDDGTMMRKTSKLKTSRRTRGCFARAARSWSSSWRDPAGAERTYRRCVNHSSTTSSGSGPRRRDGSPRKYS